MFSDNEGTIPLLWKTSDEKQTEHKKRNLGIPIVILAVIASLAMIFYVGMNFEMNSTPVGVISTNSMIAGRGMRNTILGWQSGWKVMLVDNFGVEYDFIGGSSMWDPVAHDSGNCYGRNNVTGTTLKYKYQVDSRDGTPGDFLINEIPYTLSLNGTMFLIKEVEGIIIVQQVDKDLSFFEDLFGSQVYNHFRLLGINDTDITAFYQDEAFDDAFLRL